MPNRSERKARDRIRRRAEGKEAAACADEVPAHRKLKKSARPFRLQIRLRPGHGFGASGFEDWISYWKKYATEAQRDEALRTLNGKNTIFEYRVAI